MALSRRFLPRRAIPSPAQIAMMEFHAVCTRLGPKNATMLRTAAMIVALLAVQAAGQVSVDATAAVVPAPKCFAADITASDTSSCLPLPPPRSRAPRPPRAARAWVTCGVSTAIPPEKRGSCADAQAVLDAHNAARARWGANPLLWSRTLSSYAQNVSDRCVFAHSNGPYGENLAIGGGLSCLGAFKLWLAEEAQWPPGGTPGFSSATGHFSAVVWKGTVQVGCGVRACGGRNLVTCSYNPPGNVVGQFSTQVGARGASPECVAPLPGSAPPGAASPPPAAAKPPPPPPKLPSPAPPPPPRRCCFGSWCWSC